MNQPGDKDITLNQLINPELAVRRAFNEINSESDILTSDDGSIVITETSDVDGYVTKDLSVNFPSEETTASLQAKRPIKTINGVSLEGVGNEVIAQGPQGVAGNSATALIPTWTAIAFVSGAIVNYLGRDWVSNAATLSTDVPSISSKWVERLWDYASLSVGKNIFNQNDILTSRVLSGGTGVISAGANTLSNYIEVKTATVYIHNSALNSVYAFYNADKVFISGGSTFNSSASITSPALAKFLVATVQGTAATWQIEASATVTAYEAWHFSLQDANLKRATDLATIALDVNYWIPQNYASNKKVFANGRTYRANVATISTDIPGISTKWEEIENAYLAKTFGKNLFNKNTITTGFFFGSTGLLNANASYYVSDFIAVTPSTAYAFTNIGSNAGGAFNIYYGANKQLLTSVQSSAIVANTITTPANCYFIRLSSSSLGTLNTAQVEQSAVRTGFEAYSETYAVDNKIKVVDDKIENKYTKAIGKNRFNVNATDIILGSFLDITGSPVINATYNITGFIPIKAGETLRINDGTSNTYICLYDANKQFITGTEIFKNTSQNITHSGAAAFARFTYKVATSNIQVELGTVSTAFERYSEINELLTLEAKVNAFLPSDVPVVILPSVMNFSRNHAISIYQKNALFAQFDPSNEVWFSRGINYQRQVAISEATAGSGTFTTQIEMNQTKGELKTINYVVTDPAILSGTTKKILCIGDSFTDIGHYVAELKTLLNSAGCTVNQLGSMGVVGARMEALSGGTMSNFILSTTSGVARLVDVTGVTTAPTTGFPGVLYQDSNGNQWSCRGHVLDGSGNGKMAFANLNNMSMATFPSSGNLTKVNGANTGSATIAYTNATAAHFNPFWNPGTNLLDFNYYLAKWGFANPDAIVIQFTYNDLALWASDVQITTVVNQVKTIVDAIKLQLPSCKVVFSIEPAGAEITTQDITGRHFSFLKFARAMFVQFTDNGSYNAWMKVAPSYAYVDLLNGYTGGVPFAINSRYPDVTESYSDGVHCNQAGMKQIADCIFDFLVPIL